MQPVILEPFSVDSDSDNSDSNSTSSSLSMPTSTAVSSDSDSESDTDFDSSEMILDDIIIDTTNDDIPNSDPLYSGSELTVSTALAILFSWFTSFPGVSKEALGHLLLLLHHFILPNGNRLPSTYASAYDLIKSLLVPEKEYHCCINDCIIFRDAYKDHDECPECNEPRYVEGGKIPRKKFKYLPLGPRLHRLFGSSDTSQLLQNHMTSDMTTKVSDLHDTDVWKNRYSAEGPFAGDSRGLSLAICADGTNPFSKEKTSYSMWPILISILNLPSHLRRQPGYLQLVGIIPGRNEPKNTDPYIEILVEELQQLNGEQVYDSFQNNMFSLKADIFLHIMDYPGQNKLFHCNGELFLL